MTCANATAFHVYRYQLRPMRLEQETMALQSIGNARWSYNQAVALNRHLKQLGENTAGAVEIMSLLPDWKADHLWLRSGSSQTLQQALIDYGQAQTANRQDPQQFKPPVFKKRDNLCASLRFPQLKASDWNPKKGWINLPKLGQLRYFKDPRAPHGTLKHVSLMREGQRWMVCLCVEQTVVKRKSLKRHTLPVDPRELNNADIVGIDLGHVHAVTDHLGKHYDFPLDRVSQLDQRIAQVQVIVAHKREAAKALAKHHKTTKKTHAGDTAASISKVNCQAPTSARPMDSKRLKSAEACLRKLQTHRMDLLIDARHQLSHRLTDQSAVVCVEDLKLKKLLENAGREVVDAKRDVITDVGKDSPGVRICDHFKHGSRETSVPSSRKSNSKPMPRVQEKSLHRGWACLGAGIIIKQLHYKAARKGGVVIKVNPAYTSQTCPECNHNAKNNRESQAVFRCKSCSYENNADNVGAINVRVRGMETLMADGFPQPKPPKHRRPRNPKKKKVLGAQAA